MYRVEYDRRAGRELEKLPLTDARRIARQISRLGDDPRPPGCKKLADSGDLYRIRAGRYRVVYQIRDEVLMVIVVRVSGRHEGTYRRL